MRLTELLKQITKRQWLILAYLPIHFIWFFAVEAINITEYTPIYSVLDDMIPFCEWFIFPYMIWFLYMMIPAFYFLFKESAFFEKFALSLFIGFIISLLIITLWPTGQDLRPVVDPDKNFASWIVAFIYDFDTNTNVFPSMHVVGTVAVAFSLTKSKTLGKMYLLQILNWVLCLAIIAATVFLKQHSILDVFSGIIIEIPVLIFVFSGAASRLLDRILGETAA